MPDRIDISVMNDAAGINNRTLLQLVSDNAETEFGRKHSFSEIKSPDDYRRLVPINDYSAFEEYIDRMKNGEKNLLVSDKYDLLLFGCTSGTTGSGGKRIPVTREHLQRFIKRFDAYADEVYHNAGGKRVHEQIFRTHPGDNDDKLLISELINKYKVEWNILDPDEYVGGAKILFDKKAGDGFFAKAYTMLAEENVTVIQAIYQYDHLRFFTYLEKNIDVVLDAIINKKIPDEIDLSEEVKNALLSLPVSEKRINDIIREKEKGFDGIALRLWPSLKLLSGIMNYNHESEDNLLMRYAKGVPRYSGFYFSTECYIAEGVGENDFDHVMIPGIQFLEFIPCDGESEDETCLPEEVEIGRIYEPVISTFSGLYRYRMGDAVKITGRIGKSPVFRILGRRSLEISIAGEKTSISQLEDAAALFRKKGVDFSLFCFGPGVDNMYAGYRMVISCSKEGVDENELSEILDSCLKKVNTTYKSIREMNFLDPPDVYCVDPAEYFSFLQENNILKGNVKPAHISVQGFEKWR